MEYVVNGKVRDLQAALFPVQPIPGNNLTSQCLHAQIGIERKDLNSELSLTSGYVKYRDSKDNFESFFIDSNHLNGLEPISQEARWPVECQVLEEKIHHIEDGPEEPEPFYVPTGKEPRPKPIGEESGTVIFRYVPMTSTNYFSRSCIGGSEVQSTVPPQQQQQQTYYEEPAAVDATSTDGGDAVQAPNCVTTPPPSSRSSDLCFESRFESGNLGKVIKITDTFYQLHLRKDLYTQKHMQWFYFRITNMRNDVTYRLSIVNLVKEDSLYNEGLRPLLYSTKEATTHAIGWRRCGENISYYRNDTSDDDKDKHTLTFNITFPHDQDVVYLAHCYPYTYTKLQNYLTKIAKDPVKSRYTKLRLLCRSLAGNSVYYLTITSPTSNDEGHNHRKKGIVLTARVHPGETPSSWIMKGMIDFLTGDSNQARELRDRFIFKLIPMLNPDGVIVGNNRCSLSGKDLNRQYRTVMRESYPSVWHTKLMIRRLMEECGIAMYCDLHAHSRKHNIFIYGCENKRPGFPARLAEQVFPLMLHKNSADKFSFENCKFHIEKGKEGTGRVVVWLMGIQNSYTMEASLGGTVLGSRNGTHFCTQDYEQFGKAFCETLIDFSDDDPSKEKLRNKILARLTQEGSSADEPTNIELTDYSSDEGDTSDDSSDEEGKKRTGIDDRRYLTVPPPSPVLLKPATADPLDKTVKRKSVRPRLCVRKSVRSRKAINLPTTDPGSDLYMSDTADEINVYSATEMKSKSSGDDEDLGNFGKENRPRKKSEHELPVLVRPRSLSLGEEILAVDLARKNKRRYRQRRLPRPLRTLSPVNQTSQDVQVKLLPFKYNQIWTGLGSNYQEMSEVSFANTPLSFGISKMVAECQKNSELLLESCSKKLEELSYTQNELKKQKKKVRKKPTTKVIAVPTITSPDDDSKATIKKKKVRVKRTKILKTGLEPADNNGIVLSSDTIDTLKLFGTAKLPKIQTKPKSDSKKKLNKTIIAAAIATTKLKPKPVVDSAGDSSGSENSSVIKCKSEKKTKKSATRKKCTLSAKNNSVKKEIKQISTQ